MKEKSKHCTFGVLAILLGFLGVFTNFFSLIGIFLGVIGLFKDRKRLIAILGIVLSTITLLLGRVPSINHTANKTSSVATSTQSGRSI